LQTEKITQALADCRQITTMLQTRHEVERELDRKERMDKRK
jgi:hypothetical protein